MDLRSGSLRSLRGRPACKAHRLSVCYSRSVMAQFNIGDAARLKSGGPDMTVSEIRRDGKIACVWFDDKNQRTLGVFESAVLQPSGEASGASSRGEGTGGPGGPGSWMR